MPPHNRAKTKGERGHFMSYEVYYFGYDGRSLPSIDSDVSEAYVRRLIPLDPEADRAVHQIRATHSDDSQLDLYWERGLAEWLKGSSAITDYLKNRRQAHRILATQNPDLTCRVGTVLLECPALDILPPIYRRDDLIPMIHIFAGNDYLGRLDEFYADRLDRETLRQLDHSSVVEAWINQLWWSIQPNQSART